MLAAATPISNFPFTITNKTVALGMGRGGIQQFCVTQYPIGLEYVHLKLDLTILFNNAKDNDIKEKLTTYLQNEIKSYKIYKNTTQEVDIDLKIDCPEVEELRFKPISIYLKQRHLAKGYFRVHLENEILACFITVKGNKDRISIIRKEKKLCKPQRFVPWYKKFKNDLSENILEEYKFLLFQNEAYNLSRRDSVPQPNFSANTAMRVSNLVTPPSFISTANRLFVAVYPQSSAGCSKPSSAAVSSHSITMKESLDLKDDEVINSKHYLEDLKSHLSSFEQKILSLQGAMNGTPHPPKRRRKDEHEET